MKVSSPVPSKSIKTKHISFPEAIQEVMRGGRVRKEEWGDDYVFLMGWPSDDAHLTLMKNGIAHEFTLRAIDMTGDYVVVAW